MSRGFIDGEDAIDLLHRKLSELDFPNVSFEESISNSEAKRIIHRAICHLMDDAIPGWRTFWRPH